MKKHTKFIISLTLVISVISTGFIIAFADQENELEVPHEHEFTVTAFENGVATLTCDECDETRTEVFTNHLNERDYELLDMNNDGIINAKDYAYLMRDY